MINTPHKQLRVPLESCDSRLHLTTPTPSDQLTPTISSLQLAASFSKFFLPTNRVAQPFHLAFEVLDMCASAKIEARLKGDEIESMRSSSASAAVDFISSSDFPKGLRVLLLDDDEASAEKIKSKLEGMEYAVSKFSTDADALEDAMNGRDSFHVAIVEVNTRNCHDRFRFLEMARDLPTIMISDAQCLNIMMKSIALGAVEFLQKPLSDDKLKNIWQHVVHKAFSAKENTLPRSLRPIKETVATILRLPPETGSTAEDENQIPSAENDRFPAPPATPQLDQGGRLLEECSHEQTNCSSQQMDETETVTSFAGMISDSSESKLVDIASNSVPEEVNPQQTQTPLSCPEGKAAAEEDYDHSGTPNNDEVTVLKDSIMSGSDAEHSADLKSSPDHLATMKSPLNHRSFSHKNRTSKKKLKVDWTPDLHKRFVQAVQQLGIEQAIPSKILELMKVEGLTRHNVASHLQKYRLHQRHALPRDKEQRWPQHGEYRASLMTKKTVAAFPSYQSHFRVSSQSYPAWGHPSPYPLSSQMWGYTGYATWHPSHGSWPWKSCYRMYADAWGCPVAPSPEPPTQLPKREDVIDEVVKEAINKPWLPLPLGLKPPSVDSVLTELHRQGIHNIPSHFSSNCRP